MGLDLTIMPLENKGALDESAHLCYDRLRFDRNYQIFGQIADPDGTSAVPGENLKIVVRTHHLPPKLFLNIYEDEGLERTRQSPYGDDMVYAFAEELCKLSLPEDASSINKAIMAYLSTLERDTPIVLRWS